MKRKETRNITWETLRNKHQWTVHVTKTFSVAKYGTKEEALKEAIKFREQALELSNRELSKKPYVQENVRLRTIERKGRKYEYWIAVYTDKKGKRRYKCFSIAKHGYHDAKEAAIQKADKGRRWNLKKRYEKEDEQE